MDLSYENLKSRHRLVRDSYPANLNVRLHRALSWLGRAEVAEKEQDNDARFIFLWIAFNSAYARDIDHRQGLSEQATFIEFLNQLCSIDNGMLSNLVWKEFSGSIRVLLDTPYVLQAFWEWKAGRLDEGSWQRQLALDKRKAHMALAQGRTPDLLAQIFHRLYTLRNQIIHGGATWNSSMNRSQLRDCGNFLGKFIPAMLGLMLEHPEVDWGGVCYPVVERRS